MAQVTRATAALDRAGVPYDVIRYHYDPGAERIGVQAAAAMGVCPDSVIKTLMARVDGRAVCVMLSSAAEVSLKLLASAAGGKKAEMMAPDDAERITGYRIGGISPFAQQQKVQMFLDAQALNHGQIYLNGGQRGLQLLIAPAEAASLLDAIVARVAQAPRSSPSP